MEVPRHWREQPTRMRFEGREKSYKDTEVTIFKFPGGDIPLVGSYEQIRERFEKKGFNSEVTDEILFRLWGGIPAEAAIPLGEVAQSFYQLVGSEVGE